MYPKRIYSQGMERDGLQFYYGNEGLGHGDKLEFDTSGEKK
jgi:hypothetical protein